MKTFKSILHGKDEVIIFMKRLYQITTEVNIKITALATTEVLVEVTPMQPRAYEEVDALCMESDVNITFSSVLGEIDDALRQGRFRNGYEATLSKEFHKHLNALSMDERNQVIEIYAIQDGIISVKNL